QSINALGGFRAQGRDPADWGPFEEDARAVAQAGAFSGGLEAMAEPLAPRLRKDIDIPTIGIGASAARDRPFLVLEDMLGLSPRGPKFVKRYTDRGPSIGKAVAESAREVRSRPFPTAEHVYPLKKTV